MVLTPSAHLSEPRSAAMHGTRRIEPAGLDVVAENTFTKGGQFWILGLPIQKNGVLSVSGHNRHCEVGFNLEAYCDHHHPVDLYGQWELNWASKSCQGSIWRGCDEIWVEWISFYPYLKLISQMAG